MALHPETKVLLPDRNYSHLEQTNAMHCGPGEGGSKFTDARVRNVLDVVNMRADLAEKVQAREDDRDALKALGVSDRAFLPSTKTEGMPVGLPEALYYKVDGVEGRLGIIQIDEVPAGTKVLIRREKGVSDKENVGSYAPVSLTAICGALEEMPKTDFATIIVGREADGVNEIWTVHPGAPIRPMMTEFDLSRGLSGPGEVAEGAKQPVRLVTIEQLRALPEPAGKDYIKITPGNIDEIAAQYNVLP